MNRGMALFLTSALLLASALSGTALASPEFCRTDPIVVVDGREVSLQTSFAWSELSTVQVVSYEIEVPAGAKVKVVEPASPAPEQVRVSRSDTASLVARITVRASGSFDVYVTATSAGSKFSLTTQSNKTVTLTVPLGR